MVGVQLLLLRRQEKDQVLELHARDDALFSLIVSMFADTSYKR